MKKIVLSLLLLPLFAQAAGNDSVFAPIDVSPSPTISGGGSSFTALRGQTFSCSVNTINFYGYVDNDATPYVRIATGGYDSGYVIGTKFTQAFYTLAGLDNVARVSFTPVSLNGNYWGQRHTCTRLTS